MHMERLHGWGFFILCFVVGSLGGLAFIWAKDQVLVYWNSLSKTRKRIAIAIALTLVLAVTFFANRHKPDEFVNDALTCLTVLFALLLWGMYRVMSRFLDALHARFSKR